MSDRERIVQVLTSVERRVRLNLIWKALSVALPAIALGCLAAELLRRPGLLAVWALGWTGWLVFKATRREELATAAGLADERGGFKDELKTAFWFIREKTDSPWVDCQIHRASLTAGGLDPKAMVPARVPKGALATTAVLLTLTAALSLWPRRAETDPPLTRAMQDLLDEASAIDDERAREIEKALRAAEKGQISPEEAARELGALKELLEQGQLDAQALREGLDDLADDLEGTPTLDALAEALRSRDLEKAAELLRKLAQNAEELEKAKEGFERATSDDAMPLEELIENLKQALEAMEAGNRSEAERALRGAAQSLEQMSQKLDAQREAGEASRELDEMQKALARDMKLDPKRQGLEMSDIKRRSGPAIEGGAMALPGEASDEQNKGGAEDPMDASSSGLAPGRSQSGADAPGEPTRLDVQLAMEKIEAPERPRKEEEEIVEEKSREEKAVVTYQDVSARTGRAEEDALHTEGVPWEYRARVKGYFIGLKAPTDSGSSKKQP